MLRLATLHIVSCQIAENADACLVNMSTPKEKNISSLYLELCKFEQNGEYERALKTCNKVLHATPKDATAFHCKIVCLIQMTKFEEALKAINGNSDLSAELFFEKAYCQYRLNVPEQALVTINSAPDLSADGQLLELKAQVLYRLEKYEDSYGLYRDIIKKTNDDYDSERQANLNAVAANLEGNTIIEPEDTTYEILYNIAYQLIMNGKYNDAEKKLKQCEKLCRESLEDDGCTEEEMEQELAIIKVQLAYCYQRQNRIKESQDLYSSVLKIKSDDAALIAVASNNVVTINKDQNVFDSKKKIKSATQEILDHKLNSQQRKIIALNNCLLTYYINQPEQCKKQCEKLVEKWPELQVNATIIKALIISKDGDTNTAVQLLEKLISNEHDQDALNIRLTQVQLLLCEGNKKNASEVLHNLGDFTYRPAIVGALVSLHMALGEETIAAKVFEDTVAWYRTHQVNKGDLGNMWMQAAEFHMRHGHPLVAAKSLEELLKNSSEDLRTIAKLIMAYVKIDTEKAKTLCGKLPTTKTMIKNVNEAEVENTTWIFGTKSQKGKSDASPGTPKADLIIKKKQRKRKGKLPKNYNSETGPDPERWLPKYERTGFRKKRDRRQKDIIKGSQGTSSANADVYDYSKVADQVQESPDTTDNVNKNAGGSRARPQKKKRKGSKR